MYNITIETENAAFGENPKFEVARILLRLANDVQAMGLTEFVLKDVNGNTVGNAQEE